MTGTRGDTTSPAIMPGALVPPADVDRISSDPILLGTFEKNYTGTESPLDALWWWNHPTESTPSGRPSPLDQVRTLEAIVYGPPSPALAAATEEHHRLMEAIEAERSRTRVAIDAVLTAESHTEREAAHESAPAPTYRLPMMKKRRVAPSRTIIAVSAAAISLAGVLVGIVIGHQVGSPAVNAAGAVAIFDQPQTTIDLPRVALDAPALSVLSFRALVDSPPVYVARSTSGNEVCLVLVQPTGRSSASCAVVDSFPATGLNIKGSYQNPGSSQPDDPGAGTFRQVDVTWLPDGSVTVAGPPEAEALFSTAG